jgi:ATP-binding cassette subfamily E protein 1
MIVGMRLKNIDKKDMLSDIVEALDLQSVMEREVGQLSGGELQRFVIALTCIQKADIFMFDEPSSYLDVK